MGTLGLRPPFWNQANTTTLVVPPTPLPQSSGPVFAPAGIHATTYVFDAVIRLEHIQEVVKTSHPIQTGANVTDHAYVQPAKVILEIGMSDAMDSFDAGMWSATPSKSVSAYQTLLSIQESRIPVTLTTRLRTYENMLITSLVALDSNHTRHGLKALISFEEVMLASVTGVSSSVLISSLRPQTTDINSTGNVQPANPSAAVISQNSVIGNTTAQGFPYIPGAGNWSSDNVALLETV